MEQCNEPDEQERALIEEELAAIRGELEEEDPDNLADEIKSGDWFAKLLRKALETYSDKATPEFFASKYPGLPPDAVVDRQVALAQKYAGISGGLTATAYTAAVAATIGSAGGASPLTVPAALTAFSADLFYVTRLQLQLAYDMSVLYGQPADIDDPEDLYDLLRVAFGVKATEMAMSALNRAAPELVRVGVKSVVKGATLSTLKALPYIGKQLLQRNIIKVGIPVVGIPLAVGLNVWSTGAVAATARQIYRDKALAHEKAQHFVNYAADDGLLISVVWAAIRIDRKTAPEEMWLLKNLVRHADEAEGLNPDDTDLGIDLDVEAILAKAAKLDRGESQTLFDAALLAVTIDRKASKQEKDFLRRLAAVTGVEWDPACVERIMRENKV